MVTVIWSFAVLSALLLLWRIATFLLQWRYRCKCLSCLPSGKGHWLLGHLKYLKSDDYTIKFTTTMVHSNNWQVSVGWLGPFLPLVGIYHPAPLHEILTQPKDQVIYGLLRHWLGDGLLVSRGDKWYRNRRLLTPAFHFDILKPYVPVYNACLQTMLHKWTLAAEKGDPAYLFSSVTSLSLDIILQCAFSYKSECQGPSNRAPYVNAILELSELTSQRFLNPILQIDWLYAMTPSGWKMMKACRTLHKFSETVIKERKIALNIRRSMTEAEKDASLNNVYKTRKYCDFLDVLLTAADSTGNGLTDIEIRDEVDTFMFEGHDTTTSGISWTLYCLAKYPEHQAKVREEVRNVLMGREWLEYEDLKDLKYTQYAIKEAMRLFPPVFLIFREAGADMKINGVTIPKGTMLNVNIYALHRNPEIWEMPERYDPMRFDPSNCDSRDPLAYIPFSAGSRNCIGQNFAMNEEKVVVATIVNRFELSLAENAKVELLPYVILKAKGDIFMQLKQIM